MSAVASFTKIPKAALAGLREAAVPKKRLFGGTRDNYHEYLRQHGEPVAGYKWSGYVLATLLPYLQQQQINLMNSEYDVLGKFLTDTRKATHFIFTGAHKRAFVDRLGAEFSEAALRDFYNEFNGVHEAEAGKPMVDGIRALRQSLSALGEE